ncbi:MAG: sigma 54-interacting transcriptional regulator [Myxococcota bacterium]
MKSRTGQTRDRQTRDRQTRDGQTRDERGGDASRVALVVIDGTTSTRVPLGEGRCVIIGRAADADIVLADARASRYHARVDLQGGALSVTDLGSHNGTRLNGERLAREATRPLARGDVLTLGSAALVVHAEVAAGEPAPTAQVLLTWPELERRAADEVLRAAAVGRSVSALVVRVDAVTPELERAWATAARRLDLLAGGDGLLAALLPELDGSAALMHARALLMAVQALAREARGGLARAPDDTPDGGGLLLAASAASRDAAAGTLALAESTVVEHKVGDHVLVVAEPVMTALLGLVRRLAQGHLPVLVLGESGVGKEGIAACLHYWSEPARAARPFVALNCAALPDELIESELFGHAKGAFTTALTARAGLLETADGGTVFLDEVGDLSLRAQAKLLRAIESGVVRRVGETKDRRVEFRIVAATHRDIESAVQAGAFREDLWFRLAGAIVRVPPLRERPRDLVVLARRFLGELRDDGRGRLTLAPDALLALARHTWPGNVRELRHAIEYAATSTPTGVVTAADLPQRIRGSAPPPRAPERPRLPATDPVPATATSGAAAEGPAAPGRTLAEEVRDLEVRRIREALAETRGNQTRAAELLGVPRRTFIEKLKRYELGTPTR